MQEKLENKVFHKLDFKKVSIINVVLLNQLSNKNILQKNSADFEKYVVHTTYVIVLQIWELESQPNFSHFVGSF